MRPGTFWLLARHGRWENGQQHQQEEEEGTGGPAGRQPSCWEPRGGARRRGGGRADSWAAWGSARTAASVRTVPGSRRRCICWCSRRHRRFRGCSYPERAGTRGGAGSWCSWTDCQRTSRATAHWSARPARSAPAACWSRGVAETEGESSRAERLGCCTDLTTSTRTKTHRSPTGSASFAETHTGKNSGNNVRDFAHTTKKKTRHEWVDLQT